MDIIAIIILLIRIGIFAFILFYGYKHIQNVVVALNNMYVALNNIYASLLKIEEHLEKKTNVS